MGTTLQVHMISSRAMWKRYIITLLTWFRLDLCWKASKFTLDQRDSIILRIVVCDLSDPTPKYYIHPTFDQKHTGLNLFVSYYSFLRHTCTSTCRVLVIQRVTNKAPPTCSCCSNNFILCSIGLHYNVLTCLIQTQRQCRNWVSFYLHQLFRKQQQNR